MQRKLPRLCGACLHADICSKKDEYALNIQEFSKLDLKSLGTDLVSVSISCNHFLGERGINYAV